MSWLFGSKKSKTPAPPQQLTSEIAALDVKEDGDFILVDNDGNRNNQGTNDPPPMYPLIPGAAPLASTSHPLQVSAATVASQTPTHQLHGVPFRLSKETSMFAMSEQSHYYILQRAQTAINNVDTGAFKYDFAVEKSVLKETGNF